MLQGDKLIADSGDKFQLDGDDIHTRYPIYGALDIQMAATLYPNIASIRAYCVKGCSKA